VRKKRLLLLLLLIVLKKLFRLGGTHNGEDFELFARKLNACLKSLVLVVVCDGTEVHFERA
jgi:hypothetical protein